MIEGAWKGTIERKSAVADADVEDGRRRKPVMLENAHRARPGRQARQLGKRRRKRAQPVLEMRGKPPAGVYELARIAECHHHPSRQLSVEKQDGRQSTQRGV